MSSLPLEIGPDEVRNLREAGEPVHLIDVRESWEHAAARLDGAELIPMRAIPQALPAIQQISTQSTVVVFCEYGIRSLQVVSWLRRQGVQRCQSLRGGIAGY